MEKNIILSDIDNVLLTRLNFEAKSRGTDLKTLIISIIKKSLGLEKFYDNNIIYNDLDYLTGTWTKEDYTDFITKTSGLNTVDNELWK